MHFLVVPIICVFGKYHGNTFKPLVHIGILLNDHHIIQGILIGKGIVVKNKGDSCEYKSLYLKTGKESDNIKSRRGH